MKKILFALPFLFAMLLAACDASTDDIQPGANVTVEELTNSFELVPKSAGNNNITVQLSPVHYVKVYRADNDVLLAEGTNPSFQVTPPTTDLGVYITTINPDGSITKSDTKNITITEYTDLPAIFEQVFGLENGVYGTTIWTWDDTQSRYWGNGGWGSDTTPAWWGAPDQADINEQAEGKGMPQDGVPLLGVLPNDGNQRCYTYQILKADGEHLVLAAQSIATNTEGWFFCFKRVER